MKKSAMFIVGLLVVVVLGVVLFLLTKDSGDSKLEETATIPAGNTITYTESGFSPEKMRLEGMTLTIKNESSDRLQFSSDLHPSHQLNPELNAGVLEPGQSTTRTVTTSGTWGYHNHLDANDTGTVIVE